jgi:hypothetical protein
MVELKCKVVGLSYHKVKNPVTSGDTVYLIAESNNEFDNDAIAVYNKYDELLGYVANSDKSLSQQNRANGNKSALELQFELDFSNKYHAVVNRAFSSCIYLKIDSNDYELINKENTDDFIINELKIKLDALIIENTLLKSRVDKLESMMGGK